MAYDFNITKGTKRKICTIRKIWKLHEDSIRRAFIFYVKEFNESSETDAFQRRIPNPIKHLA